MIKYPKTNPVGIDVFVSMMQNVAQSELPTLFGVNEAQCLFYGRGETAKIADKELKVVYSSGKDYDELGYSDKVSFVSYLMVDGLFEPDEKQERVNVSLYCHGDLGKLFTSISHRADEELRKVMKEFVYRLIEPQDMRSIELLEEMQPYHSFKINFTIV